MVAESIQRREDDAHDTQHAHELVVADTPSSTLQLKEAPDTSTYSVDNVSQNAGASPDMASALSGALVQLRAAAGEAQGEAGIQARAAEGVKGSGGAMPYAAQIQAAFGSHDVSGIQAYQGGDAAAASKDIGARAYATGDKVAFGESPDLHTAAHEAAHVVQQRAGVSLKGGVGQSGDTYEQHADAVADLVVQGKSAEGLLDQYAGGGGGGSVQRSAVQMDTKTVDLNEGATDTADTLESGAGTAEKVEEGAGDIKGKADAVGAAPVSDAAQKAEDAAKAVKEKLTDWEAKLRKVAPYLPKLEWSQGKKEGKGGEMDGWAKATWKKVPVVTSPTTLFDRAVVDKQVGPIPIPLYGLSLEGGMKVTPTVSLNEAHAENVTAFCELEDASKGKDAKDTVRLSGNATGALGARITTIWNLAAARNFFLNWFGIKAGFQQTRTRQPASAIPLAGGFDYKLVSDGADAAHQLTVDAKFPKTSFGLTTKNEGFVRGGFTSTAPGPLADLTVFDLPVNFPDGTGDAIDFPKKDMNLELNMGSFATGLKINDFDGLEHKPSAKEYEAFKKTKADIKREKKLAKQKAKAAKKAAEDKGTEYEAGDEQFDDDGE